MICTMYWLLAVHTPESDRSEWGCILLAVHTSTADLKAVHTVSSAYSGVRQIRMGVHTVSGAFCEAYSILVCLFAYCMSTCRVRRGDFFGFCLHSQRPNERRSLIDRARHRSGCSRFRTTGGRYWLSRF
jgi:hypothetical protein